MKHEIRISTDTKAGTQSSSSDSVFQHQTPLDPFATTLSASTEVAWGISNARSQSAPVTLLQEPVQRWPQVQPLEQWRPT